MSLAKGYHKGFGLLLVLFMLVGSGAQAQSKQVEVQTNFGTMRFVLYDDTPKHRDEFVRLAKEGYYDGTLFYRVIQDYLIQGGSKSSRNAPPGKLIGYGSPEHTVDDEIRDNHFHKKGALCAPRQDDAVNPFKQSDISQFYVVKGQVFTDGHLDTLELAVNRPIKNKITAEVYTPEVKAKLKQLKAERAQETDKQRKHDIATSYNQIARKVKEDIKVAMELNPNMLHFTPEQRKAYTTAGGYPELDGKYTVFGECISGMEVIDKIARLKTDSNKRPYTDVKITVRVIE